MIYHNIYTYYHVAIFQYSVYIDITFLQGWSLITTFTHNIYNEAAELAVNLQTLQPKYFRKYFPDLEGPLCCFRGPQTFAHTYTHREWIRILEKLE